MGAAQAEAAADLLFGLRADVAEGADGAGDLADPHLLGGGREAGGVAAQLVVPERQFQAEGDRLGVDAVGAADLDGVFELEGALLQNLGEFVQRFRRISSDAPVRHQGLRGVDDIVGRQAVVEPAGCFGMPGGRHALGDGRGERDDVVPDLALDVLDAVDVEIGVLAEQARGVARNFAHLGQRLGRPPAPPPATGGTGSPRSRFGPSRAGYSASII